MTTLSKFSKQYAMTKVPSIKKTKFKTAHTTQNVKTEVNFKWKTQIKPLKSPMMSRDSTIYLFSENVLQ
jgi:hypothetical protein